MKDKEYICETFRAWFVEDDIFQLKPQKYPVILSFTCNQFKDFRKDLLQFEYSRNDEFDFREDYDCIRIYGEPTEEKIYIIFSDLEAVSVGFSEELFKNFYNDVISFNPQASFPEFKKIQIPKRFRRQDMNKQLIQKHQCKKCKGIIVRSHHTMMMANYYGKSCGCESEK